MKINIRVTGAAGLWMNSTADIIADVFAELWYSVIGDIEYQSIIKGGINYFDINISDDQSMSLSKHVDILIALDDKNLKANLADLRKNAVIIANKKWTSKLTNSGVDLSYYKILDIDIASKYDNTYLISLLAKLLILPKENIYQAISRIFKKKWEEVIAQNIAVFEDIMSNYILPFSCDIKIQKIGEVKKISYGNKMIALWAIESGLGYYSAYPMTPSSSILSEIIKSKKVPFLQAEDEISVINSALGASFTGTRSMVGTSGGGFALMTEALSFAVQAEIPITVVLSQRAGPSTGTPTFHEQGDINFALNPTFWDFQHIVIVPSTLEDAYYASGQALNLAEKYQSIVLVLIDKQFSDGKVTLGELKTPWVIPWKWLEHPPADYKRYELTDDGISPMVQVGTKDGDFIATSYEHDQFGATTEDPLMKIQMTEKRFKKLENFFEKEEIRGYEIFHSLNPSDSSLNEGANKNFPKKIIITTSFITYTAREFVKNNPEYGLIVIKFLKPLDTRLRDELIWKEEVIFVEHNYTGQLENYIVKEFGLAYLLWRFWGAVIEVKSLLSFRPKGEIPQTLYDNLLKV
jgi:2-oxoglutarate/2-oxoacid ferredoxin oxidoreductase subunit alpha